MRVSVARTIWKYTRRLITATLVVGDALLVISSNCAMAQIIPDSTLGAESSTVTSNISINGIVSDRIDGGAIRSTNLFHSFQDFNINLGKAAYFTNPAQIENILTRVTGTNLSNIVGKLGVLGNANLFLINPNGIVFEKSASLDVNGSFIATTANAIQLANGDIFSTNLATSLPSQTLNVTPSAFLFNQIANQPINSIKVDGASLSVPDGKTLLLLGGDVKFDGGKLFVPSQRVTFGIPTEIEAAKPVMGAKLEALGGRVELAGVAGSGTVGLSLNSNNLSLNFPKDLVLADILINNGARVNVAAINSGSIAITGRNINILGASSLTAGIQSGTGFINSQAGDINLQGQGAIAIGDYSIVVNDVNANSIGNSGNINIKANSLALTDGGQLSASSFGQGNAGDIFIEATDFINFTHNQITTNILPEAVGKGGTISLKAKSLSINDETLISASSFARGDAGNILINVSDNISITNSSIFSTILSGAIGQGGNISIQAESLAIKDEAIITTTASGDGKITIGDAGTIFVEVKDSVLLSNNGRINSNVRRGTIGDSGTITINARSLTLKDGGRVGALTEGTGNAGNIQINATDFVSIDGSNPRTNNSSGLFTRTDSVGSGGNITVNTSNFYLANGAVLNANTTNIGDGGKITLNTGRLDVLNGAQILSTSASSGRAGTININATDSINISGSDANYFNRIAQFGNTNLNNQSASSGLLTSTIQNSTANAGDIYIKTTNLNLSNGVQISSQSQGKGRAGNISINADGIVTSDNGNIIASATQAGGGDINIKAKDIRLRQSSLVSTSVFDSTGGGGDITITSGILIALEDSDILANAKFGSGGNIKINSPVFIANLFASSNQALNVGKNPSDLTQFRGNNRVDISASSAFGTSGVVAAPTFNNLQNSLSQMSANFVSAEQVLAGSCLARRNGEQGSFVVTGTGGLPPNPYDVRSDRYSVSEVSSIAPHSKAASLAVESKTTTWKVGDPILEAQKITVTASGTKVLAPLSSASLTSTNNLICYSN